MAKDAMTTTIHAKKKLKTRVGPNPSNSLASFAVNVKPLFKFGFSTSWPEFGPTYVFCKWGCPHDKLKTLGEISAS